MSWRGLISLAGRNWCTTVLFVMTECMPEGCTYLKLHEASLHAMVTTQPGGAQLSMHERRDCSQCLGHAGAGVLYSECWCARMQLHALLQCTLFAVRYSQQLDSTSPHVLRSLCRLPSPKPDCHPRACWCFSQCLQWRLSQ